MANEFGPAMTAYAAGLANEATADEMRYMTPSLINLGLSEGMSGRGMLSAFRAAGMTMGDRSFWNMLHDVESGNANVQAVQGLDLAEVPSEEAFTTWTGTNQAGYYYQFNAIFERPGINEGETETISKLWGYTSRTPLALGDVLTDVHAQILDMPPDLSDEYNETLVGLTLNNLYQMTPGG